MKKTLLKLKFKKGFTKSLHFGMAFSPMAGVYYAIAVPAVTGEIGILIYLALPVALLVTFPIGLVLVWLLGKAGFTRAYVKMNNDEDQIRKAILDTNIEKAETKKTVKQTKKELKKELKKLKPNKVSLKKLDTISDTMHGINSSDEALKLENNRLMEQNKAMMTNISNIQHTQPSTPVINDITKPQILQPVNNPLETERVRLENEQLRLQLQKLQSDIMDVKQDV